MPAGSASKGSSPSGATRAYPVGPQRRLDQVEMLRPAGVRHRRLCALDRRRRDARRLAGAGLLRGRQARPCRPRRHRLQPRRGRATCSRGSSAAPQDRALRRKADRPTRRAACAGCSPSWWPRSSSAPGPPTACCATPLPRPARGQAGARGRPRGDAERRPADGARAPPVRLTHPDRVYWPDAGVTKQGLADYYAEVWPRMAPLRRQPAARAAALPGRHRRPVLLPEARLEGPEPRDPRPSTTRSTTTTSRSSRSTISPG